MIDPNGILMIEPKSASAEPVIDSLTRKMTAAWRNRRDSPHGYRGFHLCNCGAGSDNKEHWVGGEQNLLTNSLCVHYLAYHRAEVPQEELDKVAALTDVEIEPTADELQAPKKQSFVWRKP